MRINSSGLVLVALIAAITVLVMTRHQDFLVTVGAAVGKVGLGIFFFVVALMIGAAVS
jgi:hypothetical protein